MQSQETLGVTGKFGLGVQDEAGQRLIRILPRERTHHSKHLLPATQEKTTHGHHQMANTEIRLIIFFAAKDKSAKTRLGADCGSDHEFLIAKFRLKLKKVGKTTRPFRYDLNQIPYDYTVEVRNRFKGLHLIDRQPDELWTEAHDIVQETGSIPKKRPSPRKRNAKKQNGCLRRPYK